MPEPIMIKVKGDGIEINLAVWEGSGRPILGIHGITANCRCWDVLADALTSEYRMLAMDLRGRGGSDKPPQGYSLDYHMRDINCLLDDLGIDRTVIMGHSLGAFIGLAFFITRANGKSIYWNKTGVGSVGTGFPVSRSLFGEDERCALYSALVFGY